MKEFKELLDKKGYRSYNVNRILKDIKNFERWRKNESLLIRRVEYKDILVYIASLKNGKRIPNTINGYLRSLDKYFNYLLSEGKVNVNPCKKIIIKGNIEKLPPVILKKEELDILYENWKVSNDMDYRDKVMIGLLVYQGLSTREVMELEIADLKLEEGKILIKGSYRSNRRVLTLESKQVIGLYHFIHQVRGKNIKLDNGLEDKVFQIYGSSKYIHNQFSILKKKIEKDFSFFVSFRQIRMSVIVNWLKSENIRVVQYKSGHRYSSSTEKYIHYDMDNLKQIIEEFHPFKDMDRDRK